MMPNFRNPFFNGVGSIDCEIEHRDFGWIPFTCDPSDTIAGLDMAAFYAVLLAFGPAHRS